MKLNKFTKKKKIIIMVVIKKNVGQRPSGAGITSLEGGGRDPDVK